MVNHTAYVITIDPARKYSFSVKKDDWSYPIVGSKASKTKKTESEKRELRGNFNIFTYF